MEENTVDEQLDYYHMISNPLNCISIVCDVIILCLILFLAFISKPKALRATHIFLLLIALCDIWHQIHQLLWHKITSGTTVCNFVAWLNVTVSYFYYTLDFFILFNLQRQVLNNKKFNLKSVYFYILIAAVFSLLASMPSLVIGHIGVDLNSLCYKSNDLNSVETLFLLLDDIWFIIILVYYLCIGCLLYSKISRNLPLNKLINVNHCDVNSNKLHVYSNKVKVTIYRTLLYQIVFILTQSLFVLTRISNKFGHVVNSSMASIGILLYSLSGILLFLILLFDPSVQLTLYTLIVNIIYPRDDKSDHFTTNTNHSLDSLTVADIPIDNEFINEEYFKLVYGL